MKTTATAQPGIVFVWENFGPAYAERCAAVADYFRGSVRVIGIELTERSSTNDWVPEGGPTFEKVTLFRDRTFHQIPLLSFVNALFGACLRARARHFFFCHYQKPAIFVVAWGLRLMGRRVYVMNDLKFDDFARTLWREFVKMIFYSPYHGALSGSARTTDYMRFLGVPANRIEQAYDARSVKRIRKLAGVAPAPEGTPFAERHFSVVARFVPKKNLALAIDAYRIYREKTGRPRELHLYGSGELEADLRARVEAAGLTDTVRFMGFLQTEDISRALGSTLALIHPSTEEQFGFVIYEAQAMGVPVIISENCGARDFLVRTAVNGFVLEPDNAEGFAYFMTLFSEDEALWEQMSFCGGTVRLAL